LAKLFPFKVASLGQMNGNAEYIALPIVGEEKLPIHARRRIVLPQHG
jgi:hypothetical protein